MLLVFLGTEFKCKSDVLHCGLPLRGGPLSAFELSLCLRFLVESCFFADPALIDRLLKLLEILRGAGGLTMHVETKS